jgi:TonB family protein
MKTPRILLFLPFALALAGAAGEKPAAKDIVTLPEIEFPTQLLHRGVTTGEVHVMVKIGPDARLIDALVTAYTHKPFADATLAALPRSTFRPLQVDGQPVTTLTELVVRFEASGMLIVERFGGDSTNLQPGKFAYQPCEPGRLDRPLAPITAQSPVYPTELRQQGVSGSVVLEYYIDESGRVRMPRVSSAANDILAGLSLLAVEQWQFQPPSSQHQPVLVRVRQKFDFVPTKPG